MILVTGGTGLVGSHLLYRLVSNGEQIRAIYRNKKKLEAVKKVFSYYSTEPEKLFDSIEWFQADLLDIPTLSEAFCAISYVYHCAGFISFDPNDYYKLRQINIEGTANIVNLSISNDIKKLCHVSSIATLSKKAGNALIDEETHWEPEANNSVYGITKFGAEMEVWRGTQEGLNAVIVNPGLILGAGFWNAGSGLLFKKVFNKLPYYATGTSGYVDVEDVVKAMIALMHSSIINERFVLVSENLSFKIFIDLASKYLKVKSPKKEVSPVMLQVGWRLDWLLSFFTGRPRVLTRLTAANALGQSNYSNKKITNTLNMSFEPVENSIKKIALKFLKEC